MGRRKVLSPMAKTVLEFIKNAEGPVTFSDIKRELEGVNPSHLGALVTRGYLSAKPTEVTELVKVTKKVNAYTFEKDLDGIDKEGE